MAPREILVRLETGPQSAQRELSEKNESTLRADWNNTYNRGLDDEYGQERNERNDNDVDLDDINDADLSFIETNRARPSYKGKSTQVYVPPNIYDPKKLQ